jgi:hypothetical protein
VAVAEDLVAAAQVVLGQRPMLRLLLELLMQSKLVALALVVDLDR